MTTCLVLCFGLWDTNYIISQTIVNRNYLVTIHMQCGYSATCQTGLMAVLCAGGWLINSYNSYYNSLIEEVSLKGQISPILIFV